ncbi:hypothetical protein LUU34_00837800 [Aix galericulata]|nr:hypothetical protein LUU34_00837800 [Aix galericulata]
MLPPAASPRAAPRPAPSEVARVRTPRPPLNGREGAEGGAQEVVSTAVREPYNSVLITHTTLEH